MFSKDEAKKLREEFWTDFGKKFPRKWILYNTKIKEIQLKFSFNTKFAQVSLDVIANDEITRSFYFEKILSLKNILTSEYLPEAMFEENYLLPEGKTVARVYIQLDHVSIHNKNDWPLVQIFLNEKMTLLEAFFVNYKDILEE